MTPEAEWQRARRLGRSAKRVRVIVMNSETATSSKIVVVGGVAGGASAAARARRLNENARIVVFERDAYISFANCGLPYHLGGEIEDRASLLVASPALFAERFGIEVHVRHEVRAIDRKAKTVRVVDLATGEVFVEPYDKLILSPGAAPVRPDLPGVGAAGVFVLRNMEDMDAIGAAIPGAERAVVIGAGYIGLEVAEQFRHRGLAVTVVEREPWVLPFLDREMAEPVQRELEAHGITLELGQGFAGIEREDGRAVAVTLPDGRHIPADLVLLGVGVAANVDLARAAGLAIGGDGGISVDAAMRTSDPDIYAVGDAVEYALGPTGGRARVPLAGIANRTGRLAGEHAARGRAQPAPAAWATSIVRVFGRSAGATGLSVRQAAAAGIDARAVHVVGHHHASYYPGAEIMALELVYAPGSGKVLGAQALGGAGIDKRLDVIATALHFGGSVHDLAALDLAYAPPFGAAKDPIHMAAFAAQNDLDGLARHVPPDMDLASFQVVDVREPDEVTTMPFAGTAHAHHVPLRDLRDRAGELDPARPTVLACRTGLRSYVGLRILTQRGFGDVYNLSGGVAMRDFALNRGTSAAGTDLPRPEHLIDPDERA
jgi:NADPH-dependent 2,4-dienoyl-CoA reductase/sulfur reductase-like enzyme/rhodanese-related sulfurtransferase